MHKIRKSKWNRKLLSILLVGFISMNALTGCSLLTKEAVNNETDTETNTETDTEANTETNTETNTDNNTETNTDGNSDTKEELESQQEYVADAYVKAIDSEKRTISVDQAELLFSTDEERLKEIGMKGDDLVTGFYIYNEEEKDSLLSYDENLTVELLDDTVLSEGTLEELEELILNNNELCKITVKDNVVVKISQIYLP